MPEDQYPLLIFPQAAKVKRSGLSPTPPTVKFPGIERQRERLGPQLTVLQQAFDAKRLKLQQAHAPDNPELVLVLKVVGAVKTFATAVSKLPAFEWLHEIAEDSIQQDDDFALKDPGKDAATLGGSIYLIGTNQEALAQLLSLWNRYQRNPTAKLDKGLAPFKQVFSHLRTIRPWDASDRVTHDARLYWEEEVESGLDAIRFEIEAWYFTSEVKNRESAAELAALVTDLNGRIIDQVLIPEIAYSGLLVELPTVSIREILDGSTPELLLSDRVMYFRPTSQCLIDAVLESDNGTHDQPQGVSTRPPVVALLDGLPLANHTLLAGRLAIDDPDGWEAAYDAKDRVHGTAMASLILHGELDGASHALDRQLYVRPIMRPNLQGPQGARRSEHTPDDVLLLDLVHRAVKRICEGDPGEDPVAPTVRVINLSLGDSHRIFGREMSPWARLVDWLSTRYNILFIVSAGNAPERLELATARETLHTLAIESRQTLALAALVQASSHQRLMSPAESINAITVGALHVDGAQHPAVANRYDLFRSPGISPISRVGHGYRRSVKPDILMPGGRLLYTERLGGGPATTTLSPVVLGAPPGHRVAIPPLPGPGAGLDQTGYTRGTSNAAALTSRAATLAYDVIESLREGDASLAPEFDAVLLKALLAHGAQWGELSQALLAARSDIESIGNANTRRAAQKDYLARWLGYGPANVERALSCTLQRATLIGVGELSPEKALTFSAPLPPGLASRRAWRRLTITLAWMSTISPRHQRYRNLKLWVEPPHEILRISRTNSVDHNAVRRGTVQHEILEGEDALPFVDGDRFECKVNCIADVVKATGSARFAICVSLEVGAESGINVYEEIRARIAPVIPIRAA